MDATQLRQPRIIPIGFGIAVLVPGVGLGFGGPALAAWLVDLLDRSPLPSPGVLQVIAGLPWSWSIPIGVALGAIGAAFLASTIVHESLRLSVASDRLEYRQEDQDGWIDRTDVATVYPEGSNVVVLDASGRMRARLNADGLNREAVQSALREHGYPWRDQDPFEADYQRWADGKPGFTTAEHRLIRQWREKRRKNTDRMEAEEALRESNLVVRWCQDSVEVRRAGESDHGTDSRPATS
ncbi:YqeB family protein [Ruania halotolerans]|uniref:YqeB family protein n=1 Tax=Ruania halotolerans TaxID=2897773 RepID=UPI001E535536|nr:hypothetical protein [Ruania halotolerans]UFU07252.1 hypothetical protein LQF10_03840 [Ruania halotolerans]